nr:hypothetical protein [Tanacetum cinerariifolium]
MDSSHAVPTFQQGEYLIECINKAMSFLSTVASRFPPSNNRLKMSSNPRNQETIQDGRVTVQQIQGRQTEELLQPQEEIILDAHDSNSYELSLAKAVIMANLLSCDSDVLSKIPYSDTYLNDMINQDVQEMSYSEQTHIVDFPDNEG